MVGCRLVAIVQLLVLLVVTVILLVSVERAYASEVPEGKPSATGKVWRGQMRMGVQRASAKANSFGTYLDGQHNNAEQSLHLGGAYIGVNVIWQDRWLADLETSLLTRVSGSAGFDLDSASVGYMFHEGDALSVYALAGASRITAVRRNRRLRLDDQDSLTTSLTRREQRELGAHGIFGLDWRTTYRWTLSPSYRYADVRGGGLHFWQLRNNWMFNQHLGLSLSGNYLRWDQARQPGWQLGLVLTF